MYNYRNRMFFWIPLKVIYMPPYPPKNLLCVKPTVQSSVHHQVQISELKS